MPWSKGDIELEMAGALAMGVVKAFVAALKKVISELFLATESVY
jgi:hypothetical protein